MALNYTLKNGYNGKFYMFFFTIKISIKLKMYVCKWGNQLSETLRVRKIEENQGQYLFITWSCTFMQMGSEFVCGHLSKQDLHVIIFLSTKLAYIFAIHSTFCV